MSAGAAMAEETGIAVHGAEISADRTSIIVPPGIYVTYCSSGMLLRAGGRGCAWMKA